MGRLVARVTAAVALTAGCSTAPTPATAPAPTTTPAQSPDTPGSTSPAAKPVLRAFPLPRQLGAGWSYRVDPGDPEAGYGGTGTPMLRRDPSEVAALAVPLGCPRPALPAASKATEVDYSYRGKRVVAIRLVFDTARNATRFVDGRRTALRECIGLTGGPAVGPYVGHVGRLTNERTPESEPWSELVVRREAAVLLVAAEGPMDDSPLDPIRWRKVSGG